MHNETIPKLLYHTRRITPLVYKGLKVLEPQSGITRYFAFIASRNAKQWLPAWGNEEVGILW